MKKALFVFLGFAVFSAAIVLGITVGRMPSVEHMMQYRVGHYFEDCRRSMFDADKVYHQQLMLQPQWCRQWWSSLPDSRKMAVDVKVEETIYSSATEEDNPVRDEVLQ